MFRTTIYQTILSLIIIFVVGVGCTRQLVTDRAVDFNLAIETSTNQLLLLNAVRASQRYPMHFSQVSGVLAKPKVTGSLGFTLPFGRETMSPFSANPTVGFEQEDVITLAPQQDKVFYETILTPVSGGAVIQFLGQGWPARRLMNVLVERLYIDSRRALFLIERAAHVCGQQEGTKLSRCEIFLPALCRALEVNLANSCGGASQTSAVSREVVRSLFQTGVINNDPENEGEYTKYLAILMASWVLDLEISPAGSNLETSTVIPNGIPSSLRVEATRQCQRIVGGRCLVKLAVIKEGGTVNGLAGTLRSPQGALFYIGELIRAQKDQLPTAEYAAAIFPIEFGSSANAAISVSLEGEKYSIPEGASGQASRQLLSLVHQLFSLGTVKEDQPAFLIGLN